MHCVCCDKLLNDFESTRKHAETGEYLDMCNGCLKDVPEIPWVGRSDLEPTESIEIDFEEEGLYDEEN